MKNKDFGKWMRRQEQEKRAAGYESTADLYRAARHHFERYNEGRKVTLKDVTAQMVQGFQKWLKGKGLKVNSLNSYISNLRAMYNRACLEWTGRRGESPFAGIHLKREETAKRAVPTEVIKKLIKLDLKDEPEKKQAVDMATFTYLGCGIPYVDIAHLKKENLEEGGKVLAYHRQKTGVLIRMEVSDGMQLLIDRYSRPDSEYLFPILTENATHEQYKQCLAKANKCLKELAKSIGCVDILTTYAFRHAWASEAYHQGVPIAIISQLLGHTSEKTTRIYLSAFDLDKVAEVTHGVIEEIETLMIA